jgi:hypothetical protein
VEAGGTSGTIQFEFDIKFIAGSSRKLLLERGIIPQAAPGGLQSQNGLAESHWKHIIRMARSILVDRGMPNRLWFFALHHAVQFSNYLPIMVDGCITTSFEMVHLYQHNYQAILYPIFSHIYSRWIRDGSCDRLQFEPHSQPGITIGRSELTNGITFWNPTTDIISVSADYRLDPLGHFPSPFNIKFDGPLDCTPLATETDIAEPIHPLEPRPSSNTKAPPPASQSWQSLLIQSTSEEYQFYTVSLVTGSNRQVTRAAISEDIYKADNSELKHDETTNGIMSLPMWFLHDQKIFYR